MSFPPHLPTDFISLACPEHPTGSLFALYPQPGYTH